MTAPHNLDNTSPDAATEAREQADAYESLFADPEITLEGGTILKIPPHPDFGMLDDEAMEAYEELLFAKDTLYEREPDIYIPEQRLRDPKTGQENGIVLPSEIKPGDVKYPYRLKENGQLVKPPHALQVVKAALGEVKYKELRDGGCSAKDVWKAWNAQAAKVADRRGRPESAVSSVAVAPVPEADSQ